MDDPDLSRITETYNRHLKRAAECCNRIYCPDSEILPQPTAGRGLVVDCNNTVIQCNNTDRKHVLYVQRTQSVVSF